MLTNKILIYAKCLSGKDRTGIVVASLLLIWGIDEEVIVEEYLLSDGEVQSKLIRQAIVGIQNIEKYFDRVNIDTVIKNILA